MQVEIIEVEAIPNDFNSGSNNPILYNFHTGGESLCSTMLQCVTTCHNVSQCTTLCHNV